MGDLLGIAVEELGRHAFVGAQHPLRRLTPPGMIDLRVDVGPEAVFLRLDDLPEGLGPLVGEGEADDRLDRLETILPGHGEAQRRAVLLRNRFPVKTRGDEGKLVPRLLDRESFDIRPRIPGLAESGGASCRERGGQYW